MASVLFVVVSVAITGLCVHAARRMAVRRGRSRLAWMWSAAILGPVPLLVLGLLPRKRSPHASA